MPSSARAAAPSAARSAPSTPSPAAPPRTTPGPDLLLAADRRPDRARRDLTHYLTLGGPAGRAGLPTTDELPTPDSVGRFNHFTGSGGASIYWTPTSGAQEIQGAIRSLWATTGWERGPLGYPTTGETTTPDQLGRYNHFTGSVGSIYWPPGTGAHEVHGAIAAR